jgi:hypothetical protein
VSLYQNTIFSDHLQPYVERVLTVYTGILSKYIFRKKINNNTSYDVDMRISSVISIKHVVFRWEGSMVRDQNLCGKVVDEENSYQQ